LPVDKKLDEKNTPTKTFVKKKSAIVGNIPRFEKTLENPEAAVFGF
jgi:hypothetical protein